MNIDQERVIAYLDILGFKDLVQKWLTDETVAQRVEGALNRALEWVGGKESLVDKHGEDWHVRLFSDSVCLSQPATDLGVMKLLQGVSYFQREMLADGFAVRGGISIGRYFESNLATFSLGLVEAYELETKEAIYPRVVISQKLQEHISIIDDDEIRRDTKEYIAIDAGGSAFLCYMVFEEDDPWFIGERFYALHKKLIENQINSHSLPAPVCEKYVWLAQFHNWCLRVTAEVLKKSGTMSEEDVWFFPAYVIKNVDRSIEFMSLLWQDKTVNRDPSDNERSVDWIKEWPGAISEDDEEEPDREPDDAV